ncbi:MurR/RpiR family transcriptional regulator [Paratractidigestivibacter sp.]|uniref:MurR/RpiR family transcriptional regulator n=1 Tax=Paratractidigestivibacter sp. TaxID=2847316 RepID=UPI002AC976CC|nr:MurR/RpiR family transcriptional regulator [Paratractidigestivibacter sp.]
MSSTSPSSVVDAIIACRESLSDAEKTVANFILEHAQTVSQLSATMIARQSGTSNTTVSRFVRSIGFSSFSEMRYSLAREMSSADDRAFEGTRSISMEDVGTSAAYILENKIDELRSTLSALDEGALRQAVTTMSQARLVMFAGVGSSLSIAQCAAIKFSQARINAIASSTTDAAQLTAMLMGPEDCLVVISNSGRSDRLCRMMSFAIDQGVQTIVITRNPDAELGSLADVTLRVVARDSLLVTSFDFSHNSINYVLEVLLLLLFNVDRRENEYGLGLFNASMAGEKGLLPSIQ